MKDRVREIRKAIKQYATAYNRLEKIQRSEGEREDRLIPRQDQKTGPIGEFWAGLYLRYKYPNAEVWINSKITASYDIAVRRKRHKPLKVQVKTMSDGKK